MRDDVDREFERIVSGASGSSLPGAGRYWPWFVGVIVLAPTAAAALYPLATPAFGFMLEALTRSLEYVVRLLGAVSTDEPGVFTRSDPRFADPLLRPPVDARQELAAVFCAVTGRKLADLAGGLLPRWTAAHRGYEDGLRLTRVLPWLVTLVALTLLVRGEGAA